VSPNSELHWARAPIKTDNRKANIMTVAVPAGAKDLGDAPTFEDFARKIGDVAASRDRIIAGPTVPVEGGFGRYVAFVDKRGHVAKLLVGVGETDPGPALGEHLVRALKGVFATVTVCKTQDDFEAAAAKFGN
jgi:hypothetical protein